MNTFWQHCTLYWLHILQINFLVELGNDTPENCLLNKTWTSPIREGYVEVGEDNFCLVKYYKKYEEKIKKCEVRDDDVYLCGFPKSGTTLLAEMIWLIVKNLNYVTAKQKALGNRVFQIEFPSLVNLDEVVSERHPREVYETLDMLSKENSPRCIKTHLQWSLLPEQITNGSKKPKMIVVLRNVEDVCVSHYHYSKGFEDFSGTFEEFCELFLNGKVCFAPYWKNVLSFWKRKEEENILFLKYENVIQDLPRTIVQIANFLNKKLTTAEISKLANHLSFDSMKNNPMVNLETFQKEFNFTGVFVRRGKAGDHKNIMSEEMCKRFQEWSKNNLHGVDFSLK